MRSFNNSDSVTFHFLLIFPIKSHSDTIRFWYHQILTQSDSDTIRFWHHQILTPSDSDTIRFWHHQILTPRYYTCMDTYKIVNPDGKKDGNFWPSTPHIFTFSRYKCCTYPHTKPGTFLLRNFCYLLIVKLYAPAIIWKLIMAKISINYLL